MFDVPVAWLQLTRERPRLLAAVAGVTFAVVLVFMQLGFRDALFASSVRLHSMLVGDLFLLHPQTSYLVSMKPFSRRRLYQTLGVDGVESVSPVYAGLTLWKNPATATSRNIFLIGVDPTATTLDIDSVNRQRDKIRRTDIVLFDEASRPEYGPVVETLRAGHEMVTDVGARRVTVEGLFQLGTSFGVDGTLVTSDSNFLRLLPIRQKGLIDIGVIRLRAGADADAVRDAVAAYLPNDVVVLTKPQFMQRERAFWEHSTPIGFVCGFGMVMGLVVGLVIVYQILFADISDHLAEYATLKAMGYTNWNLVAIVFQEATILAVLGFLPGLAISAYLYRLTQQATFLPMNLGVGNIASVLALTIGMCCVSGAMALRKVRRADPAEVF